MNRGGPEHALLVAGVFGRHRGLCAAFGRFVERRRGIGHLKRHDADAIAVLMDEVRGRVLGAKRRRQHEPDIALLEHVGRRVATSSLETPVGGPMEAEAGLVKHGSLPGVAHKELEMVDAFDRAEVGHNMNHFRTTGA